MSNITNNLPFKDSEYLKQYVSFLIQLHQLMQNGKEDEADDLRELMDEPGLHLSEAEVKWVKRLSAELYSLNGEEIFESNPYSGSEWQRLAMATFAQRGIETDALLSLLRMKQDKLPEELIAYGRSRAYSAIGFYDLSLLFLQRVMQLSSDSREYLVYLMNDLRYVGQYQQVWEIAQSIFENDHLSPDKVLLAFGTVFEIRDHFSEADKRNVLGRLRLEIEKLLRSLQPDQSNSQTLAFANIFLGLIQKSLGRMAKAEAAFLNAAHFNPGDDAPWLLLGDMMLVSMPGKAEFAFRHAIELGTRNPVPYLVMGMGFLNQGSYQDALKYCHLALANNFEDNEAFRSKIQSAVDKVMDQVREAENKASMLPVSTSERLIKEETPSVQTQSDQDLPIVTRFTSFREASASIRTEQNGEIRELFSGMDLIKTRLAAFESSAEMRMAA